MAEVNPVVETQQRRVEVVLRIRKRKTRQQRVPDFGPPVAVGVFKVQHVGCIRDDHALLPAHDARGQRQPVGEHLAFVHPAVVVGVGQ